ncbi:hypothetical protein BUALT_Bualt12G0076600 [Buddleja alternifolia]|uniref:GTD-binding domain-containing protein n=1 Tax=Buddleja alternifolia TaxID=168488 RepID=A0AAV6WPA0_9LAMI|nr:hypothetical protein BUALT_Bualt12G0076600 [Buddleja alternifolia]
MADHNSMVMSQAEISNLKDTLCAQQKLLQKLYNELDAERESSATAASEALNVILRLQGEKAAVKMEAEQYKRLAEEKMCHAEESFAIIEDIIYQKEMEVAALDYQVQAYRHKLLSMGCVDPAGGEIKFPENLLQRNENLSPETGFNNIGRRNSAPIPGRYKKGLIEREGPTSPDMDLVSKTVEEQMGRELNVQSEDSDKQPENSYSEQIKKLNERVKEIAGVNYVSSRSEARSSASLSSRPSLTNLQSEARSPSPRLIIGNTYDKNKLIIENEIVDYNENLLKKDGGVDYTCSTSVHDVFEVPQADESLGSCESVTKDKKFKTPCGDSGNPESEDLVHPEAVKLCAKEVPDWLKKLLQSTHREKSLCRPSDIASVDCGAVVQPSTSGSASQPGLNQLNGATEIVQAERLADREEELKLLKEIKDQLNVLQDEIRSQKVTKSSTRDEPSCLPLSEIDPEDSAFLGASLPPELRL